MHSGIYLDVSVRIVYIILIEVVRHSKCVWYHSVGWGVLDWIKRRK